MRGVRLLALVLACVCGSAVVPNHVVGQVVITVWSHDATLTADAGLPVVLNEVIPAFERLHPDIKIEWEHLGREDMRERMVVATAGGAGPDIIIDGNNLLGSRVATGLATPIDHYLETWELHDQVVTPHLGVYQGKTYGIPFDTKAAPLAYRVDFFEESGLDSSRPPQTWSEYLDAAKKITRISGDQVTRVGAEVPGSLSSHVRFFNVLLQQNGGQLLDETLTKVDFNNELGAETLRWLRDLVQSVTPIGYELPQLSYRAGHVGMSFTEVSISRVLAPVPDVAEATAVALPLMKGDGLTRRVASGGGTGISISDHSAHKDEAWTFVSFLMNIENQIAIHAAQESLPTLRDAILHRAFSTNHLAVGMSEAAPYILEFERGESVPEYDDVRNAIGTQFRSAFAGEISVEEALMQAEQAWAPAIANRVNAQ